MISYLNNEYISKHYIKLSNFIKQTKSSSRIQTNGINNFTIQLSWISQKRYKNVLSLRTGTIKTFMAGKIMRAKSSKLSIIILLQFALHLIHI